MDEFSACFGAADAVVLHRIYASARETDDGEVCGRDLFDRVSRNNPDVHYVHEPEDALEQVAALLRPGDLFITMGAGNNWQLGRRLFDEFHEREGAST